MRDIKYIVVEDPNSGYLFAILFNGMISHVDMVPKKYKCISGGFCTIDTVLILTDSVKVFGKAESLGLNSRSEDARLIYHTLSRTLLF